MVIAALVPRLPEVGAAVGRGPIPCGPFSCWRPSGDARKTSPCAEELEVGILSANGSVRAASQDLTRLQKIFHLVMVNKGGKLYSMAENIGSIQQILIPDRQDSSFP